ncbi:50S ribosomal protein L21 [Candidatus Blochmanniella vafra str. BVAF]|uniref:Large ribosomal subunit protein bL21 n=1 Tax=Blochmanniella vafra (strain BVAF) TaxID=859654 RepID=E8Q6R1_BLOVB|nr:50S ribosomal protein L21 [Candidatus Blochmannia vafer]ADV33502.1 50S ribosomal protein L21 [Candidatus Blochmannia vafer str. BVAF]
MYAVFQIGSKQYYVCAGEIIYIDRMIANIGSRIEFNQVLFIKDNDCIQIGNPFINSGKVVAQIICHDRCKKIKIIKFRRRKHFRKSQGHRQHITKIKILNIQSS